jgi:membrane peptidoglycan carboxypeptidase
VHASADRLNGSFTHRVTMRDGRERTVSLNGASGSFTPLESIAPYMVQAVLTTEDGGFWRHKGFLPSQFKTAMQRNLAAGKVRLGASTITMQMVKNVLLSHERTLSRKLQELFLTWYLETALSKQRIMELYLNVIEFGPGIYGVTRAARHYFGKHPSELSPPEAAYLALMLPSPVRRHASWCHGAPTESMQIKLQRILGIMHDRNRLSEEDYLLWKDMPLQFDSAERNDVGSCLAEIDRLLSAQEGQRALSGLLAGGAASDPAEPPPEDEEVAEPPRMRLSKTNDTDEPREAADVDAPGRPAMDDTPPDGETW